MRLSVLHVVDVVPADKVVATMTGVRHVFHRPLMVIQRIVATSVLAEEALSVLGEFRGGCGEARSGFATLALGSRLTESVLHLQSWCSSTSRWGESGLLLEFDHLLFLLEVDRWQMILDDLILPVIYCSISFILLSSIVLIVNIHPCIVSIIPHCELIELLSKWLVLPFYLLLQHRCFLLLFNPSLLSLDEVSNRLFLLKGSCVASVSNAQIIPAPISFRWDVLLHRSAYREV